eukprot:275335_1
MSTFFISLSLFILHILIRNILSNTDCIVIDKFATNWDKIWNTIKNIDIIHISKEINDIHYHNTLKQKANIIKSSFLHTWTGYATYALGHDEIAPLSKLPIDPWGGLGSTLVDSLDTIILMDLKEHEFEKYNIFNVLQNINFNKNIQVSFFETTIRHLGGLISSYEISKWML